MLVILLLTAIPLCFVVANSLTMRKVSNKDAAARWVTLSQSGHAPMWDSPNEVIAEIIHTAAQVQ